jgi:hypothetical protein
MTSEDHGDHMAAIRAELEDVETHIRELRQASAELRRQIGEGWFEPTDAPERAALITAAEEQEALAESLESRRAELLKTLGREG